MVFTVFLTLDPAFGIVSRKSLGAEHLLKPDCAVVVAVVGGAGSGGGVYVCCCCCLVVVVFVNNVAFTFSLVISNDKCESFYGSK